jgi:hypothetical protein
MPMDFACDITLLQSPSRLNPDSLNSVCLILAISKTCFKETVPTTSLPGACPPRIRFFRSLRPAACIKSHDVGGLRSSKWNVRSGRTVTRAGVGIPGVMCAVRALNSCQSVNTVGESLLTGFERLPCKSPCSSLLYCPMQDPLEDSGLPDPPPLSTSPPAPSPSLSAPLLLLVPLSRS